MTWQDRGEQSIVERMNSYHLSTVARAAAMRVELDAVHKALTETHDPESRTRSLDEEQEFRVHPDITASMYLAEMELVGIVEAQDLFCGLEFEETVLRTKQQFSELKTILRSEGDDLSDTKSEHQKIRGLLLSLEQLSRMHRSHHAELAKSLTTQAGQGFVMLVGAIIILLVVSSLVTARLLGYLRLASGELHESEERFRAIFQEAPDAVFLVPTEGEHAGRIVSANARAEELHGYSPGELTGVAMTQLVNPKMMGAVREGLRRLASGENLDVEFEHVRKDGTLVPLAVTATRVLIGGEAYVLEFDRDITERKEADAALRLEAEITKNLSDGVCLVGLADERIVHTNRQMERMFGYGAGEMIGMEAAKLSEAASNGGAALIREIKEEILLTDSWRGEIVNVKSDGTRFWTFSSTSMHENSKYGAVAVSVITDITERKVAEAKKDEYHARSVGIVRNSVDTIITIDDVGAIESINPAGEALFGYSEDELVGENVRILMPEPHRGNHDGYLERYKTSKVTMVIDRIRDVEGVRKDGTTFPLRLGVSEVTFGGRRIFAGIIHDLTYEFELEQQLLQSQKMESLGTLAGGIAHDFNNILQAILGFSKLALENVNDDAETVAECLKEIEGGGRRAADLVDQILTFSRKTGVAMEVMALQPLIEESLRFIRNSIPTTIGIESTLSPDCGRVSANVTQIHQVVTNLCTNAMHSMEDRGGLLSISLEPFVLKTSLETLSGHLERGEYVRLSVSDTGSGIDAESLRLVLDPFFTTKEVGKGTGLGLAMVHGIVKSMGGGLDIESELGVGTTVRVTLPVVPHGGASPAEREEAPRTALKSTGHVLVVDDEEAITKLVAILLKRQGLVVDTFNDVGSALTAVEEDSGKYDLALLDYTMPGKTGLELAKDIESLNSEMRVLIMTGLMDSSKLEEFRPPNVVGVIGKPFDVNDLIETINRAL